MIAARIRDRFLRDPLPVRLGGLAADLLRIASCVEDPRERDALVSLLEEGKWFAEWAAEDAPLEVQERLAEVQVRLACWQHHCRSGIPEVAMPAEARRWSDQLLALAGLQ